ncbi:LysR substrate-binding domain-containing protein [Colwelliaceae bacterium BS250]
MQHISLRQLQVFSSVARTANLGETAQLLFMTKGAASQAIKSLEQQLSVNLFDRVLQRLVLNTKGRMLQPLAEDMLARQQGILGLFDTGALASKLRIGASLTIGNYLLPELLANDLQDIPRPTVTVQNSLELQKKLLSFDLDIAFIESETILTSLCHKAWRDDEMILVASNHHPLAGKTVNWQDLNNQNWVLREPQSGSREQFDHHVAPHLECYQIQLELTALEAVIRSVAVGLGLTLASRLSCELHLQTGTIAEIKLPTPIIRRLAIVYNESNEHLPQLQYLLSKLVST